MPNDLPTSRRGQYETIALPLPPEEVLPLVNNGQRKRASILGMSVRVVGTRLRAFKEALVCAGCGRIGSRFYLERHWKRGPDEKYGDGWHLNLYAVEPNGSEVLMTRDHIVPRSKGGLDRLENCQTMCHLCNRRKADSMPGEQA